MSELTATLWADDDAFIDQTMATYRPLARTGVHPEHRDTTENCRWCPTHRWHGLRCSTSSCPCEGSWTSRGDDWRPTINQDVRRHRLMDQTGCDGYVAAVLTTVSGTSLHLARLNRLRRALHGGPADPTTGQGRAA